MATPGGTLSGVLASLDRPGFTDGGLKNWSPAPYLSVLRCYREHCEKEVARVNRNLNGLSDDDKACLVNKPEEQVKRLEEAVAANGIVLDKLIELLEKASEEFVAAASANVHAAVPVGTKPVQMLLQALVREWSAEGLQERKVCHDKLLAALDEHSKQGSIDAYRVVVPGSSVGRLAFEVQSRGHTVEACEGRVLQFFAAELIRAHGSEIGALRPQPFAVNLCNRLRYLDNVRTIAMPDVPVASDSLPVAKFGEFTHLYDKSATKDSFDALLTSFALDVSPSAFRFVRVAAHVVKAGGLWANFGPLAYDSDYDDAVSHGLELSWEELRFAVSHFFDIKEEVFVESLHAANAESLMQQEYSCVFFKATRNNTPATGIGEK